MSREQPTGGNKPVDHIQVGNVRIAIWANNSDKGTYYTASAPELSYKDGDQWKASTSYGAIDLLTLMECAREAGARVRELNRTRNAARSAA